MTQVVTGFAKQANGRVLADTRQPQDTTMDALRRKLEALEARNELLEAQVKANTRAPRARTIKVSEKGAVSVYGMGRFPITHYAAQFLTLFDMADEIRAFIEANRGNLSWK